MRQFVAFMLTVALCGGVQASWYWPFGSDGVDERPKRISELIEPASILIEEASDLAAEDKVDEAVEKYRKALDELNRIEMENPERAKRTEFATLRNKRAYVNAAIDSLLLNQVQSNSRAVAVSDTTELELRIDRERWGKQMDKARESLDQRNPEAALAEFDKARKGTTNAVMISVTYCAMAGACCQRGAFGDARRILMRTRQELSRAGKLSDEERGMVLEVLRTLRSAAVDGPTKALDAGRRACDDSTKLETMDLATSDAEALARGVGESLDALQGHVDVFAFPVARKLSLTSSNVQRRVSILLKRMKSDKEKPTWDIDVSGLASALDAFDALSSEFKGIEAEASSIWKLAGGEEKTAKKAEKKAEKRVAPEKSAKDEQQKASRPSKPSKPLSKREQALTAISRSDWTTAERLVGEMLVEKPNGAVALNLKAAMEARQGKLKEAEDTLDQAIMSNPRSHFAYYNMANLMLQVRKDDKSVAKRYYETGRALGGPVDAHLEEVFK